MSEAQTEIVIECNDGLDVSLVSDFKELLKQAAGQNLPVVLDGSALERVDGAALQLLAAFFIEARSSGMSVVWKEPSAPLCRAATISGLKEIMDL
jgi:anti-anti-sigma factor